MQASHIRDRRTAEEIAQRISSAKLNAVFILVYYWGGKSFFLTDHAPPYYDNITEEDLFLHFINECHKRGIKVYARFSNGQEGGKGTDGVLHNYPEWQIENIFNERKRWFDLGKDEVRELQIRLLNDLLNTYPLDGIQLDYIRFPSNEYCYCEICRKNFRDAYGIDPVELHYALPTSFNIASVPLQKSSGAKVIVRFDNGIPAIAFKEQGRGWLILLNWRINKSSSPFFLKVLQNSLQKSPTVYIPLPCKELGYEEEGFGEILRILRNARIDYTLIKNIEEIKTEDTLLLLPALERINERFIAELEKFLLSGNKIIVSLGKNGIKEGRGYERLLGMEGRGRPMNGYHSLLPVENHPCVPVFQEDRQKRRKLMEEWANFRKEMVSSLVRKFYEKIKAFNHALLLSAAVFYNKNSAERVLQDWYSWLDRGIVDFVAPMAYVDDARLISAVKEWRGYDPDLQRIIPGLSIYQVKNGKEIPKDKKSVLRQLKIIRDAGARGFILFSLPFLTEDLAQELAKL